ncbi:cell-cycle control medial ring component [Triangularia verruculosa]|uniref:Cell-cycle control medial ring component n=1 Tax=Triangularia verruculosa TaxID=2587418 RepID=A0AAN6XU82_9PEZI|nr:cell-cycle control medial ring component [Triangularia verruculosa]
MTEVSFAQSFIALLGTIPSKIGHDHVEDPRRYTITTPYTIPQHPSQKPFRRSTTLPSSSSSSDTITVKATSPRNPPLSITLPSPLQITTTSILDIKNQISTQTGIPLPKIKLLHQKKPAQDSKTLKDILAGDNTKDELEFGLMIIGGAASVPAQPPPQQQQQQEEKPEPEKMEIDQQPEQTNPVAAPGQISGRDVLTTEEFWDDLGGFLEQRVKDEGVAREAVEKFKLAWTAS